MFRLKVAIIFVTIGLAAGASMVGTKDIKKQIVEVNEKVSIVCPEDGQSFYPHPTSCSKFIECNRGESKVLDCIDGLHYNPVLSWCDFPENVNCNIEDEADERCPAEGQHFYPYPLDCAKFVECNKGVYKVIDCIEGLHFNMALGYCDFPGNSNCIASTTSSTTSTTQTTTTEETTTTTTTTTPKPTTTTTTTPEPTTTTTATTTPKPTTTTTQSTTTTENPNGGPVGSCPLLNGEYVDFLTDSKYCTIYYMCVWGTPVKMDCPSGLHFNPTLNVCDWPASAGCTAG